MMMVHSCSLSGGWGKGLDRSLEDQKFVIEGGRVSKSGIVSDAF